MDEPRLIDLMFEVNARLREIGRARGTRSDEYAMALDELERLRGIHDEERLCRMPEAPRSARPPSPRRATWVRERHVAWRRG